MSDQLDLEIEALKAENARLREALKRIAVGECRGGYPVELWGALLIEEARTALEDK